MRIINCILITIFLFLNQVHADKACEKIRDYIFEHLSESGTLKQDDSGFVYIDIDNNYIYKLIDFIKEQGFEKPPYFSWPNGHGAHISVIYAAEAESYDIGKIEERGKPIYFKIKGCKIVNPPSWEGVESVYILTVEVPILDKIRKKYGLPKPKYDYHITIGIKRSQELEEEAA
jgi:hypothetical protein